MDGLRYMSSARREVVKQLLDATTVVNGWDSDGWIAVYVAGYNGGGEVAAGGKEGRLRVGLV
jgi:hypothetical protein